MHSQRNPAHHAGTPADSVGSAEDSFDEALLGLLIHDNPGLWSIAELSRSLTSSAQVAETGEVETHDTEDAIERLHAAGLIQRIGTYVFATRAAHTAQRLAS
jgi:hypothetical protein